MGWLLAPSFILTGCAVLLLAWAALHDLAARTVPNILPLAVFCIGVCVQILDQALFLSLTIASMMFLLLFAVWAAGAIGGGDVKLWSASVLLLPARLQAQFDCITRILLLGGVLALIYLALRLVVRRPGARRAGEAGLLVRVLRAETWRIARKAPLPYACAIAGGTIATLLPVSMVSR